MTAARDWLRRAGRGTLEDGGEVGWSVAEGSRGRRWRWTITDAGLMRHVGLVEVDTAGRFGRLELASPDGMLTLHPSDDRRELHGNVVTVEGVRPLAFPADGGIGVAIESDAFGTTVLGPGEGRHLLIGASLEVVEDSSRPSRLSLDGRGIPVLRDGVDWPLAR